MDDLHLGAQCGLRPEDERPPVSSFSRLTAEIAYLDTKAGDVNSKGTGLILSYEIEF